MHHKPFCLIIPVYNESERLQIDHFRSFVQKNLQVQLIFVDDCSTDSSAQIISDFCRDFPTRVFLLSSPVNQGKANAIRNGMLHAYDRSAADTFGFLDADLSVIPEDFVSFAEHLHSTAALTIYGYRDTVTNPLVKRSTLRKTMSFGFRWYVRNVLRVRLIDTQCGAKMFKRECLPVIFKKPFVTHWLLDLEIVFRLKKNNPSISIQELIKEIPVSSFEDKSGSKLTLKEFIRSLIELFIITFRKTN